ncbi:MAG: ABC transporter permease [Candidatus Omnitrophota bacterium]
MIILHTLFAKRNLIRELVLKDLKMRYSRSTLGFIWTFLSPFLNVAVFYLVFSLMLKVRITEAPFVFYLMSAVFPWRYFQDSLICSTTSLVDNKNLIRESNFPHYLVPFSIVLANFIIFLPASLILVITSLILKRITIYLIFLPVVIAVHSAIILGFSVMLSIFYVRWRDLKHVLEVVLLLLFYLTPAFYSLSLARDTFPRPLFKIFLYSPFTVILNLYRFTLMKGFSNVMQSYMGFFYLIFLSLIFAFVVLILAGKVYKKYKNSLNDYLAY